MNLTILQTRHPEAYATISWFFFGHKNALIAPKKRVVEAKRKEQAPKSFRHHRTLVELLNSLDEAFEVLSLPYNKLSWIHKSLVTGLRKMGSHVLNDKISLETWDYTRTQLLPNKTYPAMVSISSGFSRWDTTELMYPAQFIAVKSRKHPHEIDRCSGQHYQFGIGLRVGEKDVTSRDELAWVSGYISIQQDGSLHLHRELATQKEFIRVKNHAVRRKAGSVLTFPNTKWQKAELTKIIASRIDVNSELFIKTEFANMMTIWVGRDLNWSVVVKKHGDQLTFAIPKEDTKHYFKDRIKVKTLSGHTRPIVHFVREHTRQVKEKRMLIKEHIRGVYDFMWKDYECHVTVPNKTGVLATDWTVGGYESDDEEIKDKEMVCISKVGAMLGAYEAGFKPVLHRGEIRQ